MKRRDRNEALDARIYARAAAASLRFETWSAARWDEIQQNLTIERAAEPVAALRGAMGKSPMPQFQPMKASEGFLE